MQPTIGRIVHYRLSWQDAAQIDRRRTTGHLIAQRTMLTPPGWPAGAQAHIGNGAEEGEVFPMLIVRTWGDTPGSAVNGQVFLDGNDVLWTTSVSEGDGPGQWSWPVFEKMREGE